MAIILIVDDRPSNRDFLVTLLGYKGYRFLQASDGADALRVARAERPDLIITDILMPTMDGYEFVHRLRADSEVAQTPVIFYTAHYHQPEALNLARACGVSNVLFKPSEPETILATVEAALGLSPLLVSLAQEDGFDREHLQLLTDKLSQKANELHRANERLSALVDLGLQLGSELDPRRLLQSFTQVAREIIGGRYAITGILNDVQQIRYLFTSGMDAELAARLGSPDPRVELLRLVSVQGQCLRIVNPGGDPLSLGFSSSYPPIHAFLIAPIASPTRIYGWFCLIDKTGADSFSAEDERLAGILAGQVGRIYQNGSLYADVLRHASILEREIGERQRAEQRQSILLAVSQALADSATIREASQKILRVICDKLHWELGGLWMVDRTANVLRCVEVMQATPGQYPEWEAESRELTLARGASLPGRVWLSRQPSWISDVTQDATFLRAFQAGKGDLHAAFAFPILFGGKVLGVIDLFSHSHRKTDADLLQVLEGISGPLGQFMERKQAEQALRERDEELRLLHESTERGLARLRGVVASMSDGLVVADPKGQILDYNPAALHLHGFDKPGDDGALIQNFASTFEFSVPGGPPLAYSEWPLVRVLRGESIKDRELRVRRLDIGAEWIISYSGVPVFAPDGSIELGVLTLHDVTERRRAEGEARKNADLLRAVADVTPDAIFIKDRAGRYLLFNPAAAKFVGKPAADVVGGDDTDLFDSAGARLVKERDIRVMESGQGETEEEVLTAAGVTRTYLATKAPFRDDRGEIIGVIGISRDISDRKRAEESLIASEERFRTFMDHSPASAWITDAEGKITYLSATYRKMFHLPPGDWNGQTAFDLFPREMAQVYIDHDRTVTLSGKVLEIIEPGLRPDGTHGEFLVYKFPFPMADGAIGIGGVALDITDRKRAEEALLLRDRAIQAVTQGILITDPSQTDNPIIYASPGFERLTGYSQAEVLGKNCRFLQGPETDQVTIAQMRAVIQEGRGCSVEILNYRKDGSTFWNLLHISPVQTDTKVTHFVGVQTEVTQRRMLEEQFRQAQKMEAVGQLAGGIAHDFNNLLTVINGYSEVVLDMLPKDHPTYKLVAEIPKAGERAAGLTRQLLAFSRKQVLSPVILDLNAIVANLEKILRRVIGEDVELHAVRQLKLGHVNADAGQVEQVLMNLAVNARDAMPTGGKVTIETKNVILDEEYCRTHTHVSPGYYVLLAVSDTGHGMTEEIRRHIFEPFFTTKEKGKGTGLGLAMVHGFVKQSGGHIEVYSEPEVGASFKIYLPCVDAPSQTTEPHHESSRVTRGSETILVAEDEEAVRSLSCVILQTYGYTVLEAANGSEALRVAEAHKGIIHLLVTDVVMPRLGGRQLSEQLLALRPTMKALFLSGYTDDAVVRNGILHENVNFLQKPFSSLSFVRKVREVLDSIAVDA